MLLSEAAGESLETNVRVSRKPAIFHDVTRCRWSKVLESQQRSFSAEIYDFWCMLSAAPKSVPAHSLNRGHRVPPSPNRERERETHTHTHTPTHRHRQRQTDRQRQSVTDRQRHTERQRQTETERATERQRDRQTDRQTETETQRQSKVILYTSSRFAHNLRLCV